MEISIMSALLMVAAILSPLHAQTVPTGMTYQGRLTDAGNAPVPDGAGYEIEVRLWNASTGGTLLWGTRYSGVPLKSGAFNLILGSGGTPISGATTTDLKAAFNTPTVHLGLTTTKSATGSAISSPSEILPRQQIFSTPFAFRAETSNTTSFVQTDGVLSAAIKDGEVKTTDLADQNVTTPKIADGSITNVKIPSQTITADRLLPDCAVLFDEKASGVPGGSATGSQWNRRLLNRIDRQGDSISLQNGVISLKQGAYLIDGYASAHYLGGTCLVLRRSSTGEILLRGASLHNPDAGSSVPLLGLLVVSNAIENLEVWQYATLSKATDGLGVAIGIPGSSEIYTTIRIKRIQ